MTETNKRIRPRTELDAIVASRIKALREEAGISEYKFPQIVLGNKPTAERTKQLESGNHRPEESVLQRIANYFGKSVLYFYGAKINDSGDVEYEDGHEMPINERLRLTRLARGMSRQEVIDADELNRSHLHSLENGVMQPWTKASILLSLILGIPMKYFPLEHDPDSFPIKLMRYRLSRKMTPAELAKRLEVGLSYVYGMERGALLPKGEVVKRLFGLGFTEDDIFGPLDMEAFLLMRTGMRIRTLRIRKRITSKELAVAVGVSQQYISAIEVGSDQASIKTIARAARILMVPTGFLYNENKDNLQTHKKKKERLYVQNSNQRIAD